MKGFLYWPYDEVTVEATPSRDVITVKAPWIQAKVKGPVEPKANLEALLEKFEKKELAPTDVGLLHWFFSNFEKYPLCYILPTPKSGATDLHTTQEVQLGNSSLEEILTTGLKEEGRSDEEVKKMVADVLSNLPRKHFVWDAETALSFAKVESGIHPESVFSVARRYHLLELLENDKGKEVFQFIEGLPKEEFSGFASLVVKQNLYVTEQCQSALTPALEVAKSARPRVEHFIREERGHDRLLSAAMKSIAKDPSSVPVSSQTISLMSLLKLAAHRNFLSFAIIVDFFERSTYEKMDPLANLLKKGGFDEAAKQINRHMEINDAGEHENMGLSFLSAMTPCDPQYVREAYRIAEAASLVMNSVSNSAVKLAKKK